MPRTKKRRPRPRVLPRSGKRAGKIDPTRTLTLRRSFCARLGRLFGVLKGRIVKLLVVEDALGLKERSHDPWALHPTLNCQPGQLRGADGKCGPGVGIDIPRDEMPQVRGEDLEAFKRFCSDNSIKLTHEQVPTESLSPTQGQFRQERVDAIPVEKLIDPLLVSADDYILDGTHRWVKAHQLDRETVNVLRVGLELEDALRFMRRFPLAKFAANAWTDEARTAAQLARQRLAQMHKANDPQNWSHGEIAAHVEALGRGHTHAELREAAPEMGIRYTGGGKADLLARMHQSFSGRLASWERIKDIGADPGVGIGRWKDRVVAAYRRLGEIDPQRYSKEFIDANVRAAERLHARGDLGNLRGFAIQQEAHVSRVERRIGVRNAFCATGEGGGVDPSCSPGESGQKGSWVKENSEKTGRSYVMKVGEDTYRISHVGKGTVPGEGDWQLESPNSFEYFHTLALAKVGAGRNVEEATKLNMVQAEEKAARTYAGAMDNNSLKEGIEKIAGVKLRVSTYTSKSTGSEGYVEVHPSDAESFVSKGKTYFRGKPDSEHKSFGHKTGREAAHAALLKAAKHLDVHVQDQKALERAKQAEHDVRTGVRPTSNTRWAFHTDDEQLRAFQSWVKAQLESTVASKREEELWQEYVRRGFEKGAGRSFEDVTRARRAMGADDQRAGDFYQGGREQFLRSSFARPESVEKVKLLAARTFSDLEGVTDWMSAVMTRTLADGLVEGQHPLEIARELAKNVDIGLDRARTIARTELIRAHAEGQLGALKALGVEEVGVAVEWATAGDEQVCEECEPLEGAVFKIDEVSGLIPRHPNCRCAFIPANLGEDREGQTRSYAGVRAAVRESAEAGNGDFDVDLSRGRPQGIFNRRDPVVEFDEFMHGSGGG